MSRVPEVRYLTERVTSNLRQLIHIMTAYKPAISAYKQTVPVYLFSLTVTLRDNQQTLRLIK